MDNATGVPLVGITAAIELNEDIQAGVGNFLIYNFDTDALIASIDVNMATIVANTATIDISSFVEFDTHYYIIILNGVLTDLSGNPYAGLLTKADWDFTVIEDVPLASNLTVTEGTNPIYEAVLIAYEVDLTDSSGDPIDPVNAVEVYTADDELGTNKSISPVFTLTPVFDAGDTYTFSFVPLNIHVGKFYIVEVTPAAIIGLSPGITISEIIGPVELAPVLLAEIRMTTLNPDIKISYLTDKYFELRWFEDYTLGASTNELKTGQNILDSNTHTFVGVTEKKLEVWGNIEYCYGFDAGSQNLTYVDISSCTNMGANATSEDLILSDNLSLSTLILPGQIGGDLGLDLEDTAIPSLDLSGWEYLSNRLVVRNIPTLTTLLLPVATDQSSGLGDIRVTDCPLLSGILNMSGILFKNNYAISIGSLPLVTAVDFPTIPIATPGGSFNMTNMTNAAFTKAHLDKITVGSSLQLFNCPNITDLGSSGGLGVTLQRATPTIKCNILKIRDLASSQFLDLSQLTCDNDVDIRDNVNLGMLTLFGDTPSLRAFDVANTNLQTGLDLLPYPLIMERINSKIRVPNNNFSSAEVDQILTDINTNLTSNFTGRAIEIHGNNAAPTAAGIQEANDIAAKGVQVIHN